MADLLRGAPVAKAITEGLALRVQSLSSKGITPCLAILRVGEREDDLSYERAATLRCESLGIGVRSIHLSADCRQADLLAAMSAVNEDAGVHGCLMLRPLPHSLDEAAACASLDPAKDVDGITPSSLYGVFAGRPVGFPPCTAQACMELLAHYGIGLEGAGVCVVGRSLVIGRPVSLLLQAADATVTMCHARTRDLASACRAADVVVAAAGHADTITADCVAPGQVVVDVGINWDEQGQRLVGDVDFDAVKPIVAAITPVPGGVGSVTTAVLAKHVVEATERAVA